MVGMRQVRPETSLADAQTVLAEQYGFRTWPDLEHCFRRNKRALRGPNRFGAIHQHADDASEHRPPQCNGRRVPEPYRLDWTLPPSFAQAGKVAIEHGDMEFIRSCSVELAPPQRAEGQRRNLRPQSAWAKLFPVDGYWSPTSV